MQEVSHGEFTVTEAVRGAIVKIVDERIREAHVTKEDFTELKNIVRDIGVKVGELAEAQKETKKELGELAEAQKETKMALGELAEETKKLAIGLNRTREDLGGLSRSFSYAFENEAYRMLPKVLKDRYGIEVRQKLVRAEVGGTEINFFGKAREEGKEVYIIGETKLRLDEGKRRGDVFAELADKVKAVEKEFGKIKVVSLLVTHFATKGFLKKAEEKGVIVVQSYEW